MSEREAGVVFGGTTGFRLPNGALSAADVAWLHRDAWQRLTHERREKFAHVVTEPRGRNWTVARGEL